MIYSLCVESYCTAWGSKKFLKGSYPWDSRRRHNCPFPRAEEQRPISSSTPGNIAADQIKAGITCPCWVTGQLPTFTS